MEPSMKAQEPPRTNRKTIATVEESATATPAARSSNPDGLIGIQKRAALLAHLDDPLLLLRQPEVSLLTHMEKLKLLDLRKAGLFPTPVLIGRRAIAWRGSDIAQWLRDRPDISQKAAEQEAA
jgi:prophage regulatory protein